MDYAGPYLGRQFLVVVNAHSKWCEVFPMHSTTSAVTVETLRALFAQFGLPEFLVSDNRPNFVSAVKIFKEGLVKIKVGNLVDCISCFCTGIPPVELL